MDATDPNTTHYCTYTYGADGLRRSQTVFSESVATPLGGGHLNGVHTDDGPIGVGQPLNNETDYACDGTMLVREMKTVSGSLTPTATYLQGPGGPLYRRDDTQGEGTYTDGTGTHAAGRTRWYVYDGLGSVVGEVDPAGNLTSSGTFDVYGAKRAGGGTGTATTRQGFVGQLGHVTDSETGLVYMRARYYDPSTGRFVSEDPSENGGNWFVYADGNPTNEIDEDGKIGTRHTDWVLKALPNWEPAVLGLVLTEACVLTLIKSTTIAGYSAALALGIGATICFAYAQGNNDPQVLLAELGILAGCLKDTVSAIGAAGKLEALAGGVANAMLGAVATYSLMLVAGVALDMIIP